MSEISIDQEFKNLIPPLTPDEYQQLEQNLLKDGCRESIAVWQGVIIDGHNRYGICQKHGLFFATKEIFGINNRDEAKEWIIRNQFGRRNLETYDRTRLAFQLEDLIKARAKENLVASGGDKKSGLAPVPKAIEKIHTDEELAKIAGVSPKTIQYARKVENEATSEQKQRLQTGEAKIKTIYKELKKKEDKPVIKKPDKQPAPKIDFTVPTCEDEESASLMPEAGIASELKSICNQFMNRAARFQFMSERIKSLSKLEREAIKTETETIKKWASDFENLLNQIEKELKQ